MVNIGKTASTTMGSGPSFGRNEYELFVLMMPDTVSGRKDFETNK